MVAGMEDYLQQLLSKVDGLLSIIITDRDGVPILKVCKENFPNGKMKPIAGLPYGPIEDQAVKLGLGANKWIVCMYREYEVIYMNKSPMVITFISTKNSNTGHVLSLEEQIDPLLNDVKAAITVPR